MIMRYHWGLAVGHTYTHCHAADAASALMGSSSSPDHEDTEGALAEDTYPASSSRQDMDVAEDESSNSDAENLELGLEDLEDVDFEYDEESGGEGERDPSDDETFIAMDEMYGFGGSDEWD
jgi:hypothetical protein